MRSLDNVRISLILILERFLRPAALLSNVRGKPRPRLLTVHCDRDDRAGAIVEHVVAQNENGPLPCLVVTPHGVESGPADIAPQYSGHASRASANPSTASRFSSRGLSFAVSRASRVRASRRSLSASAASTPWLPRDEFVDLIDQIRVKSQRDLCFGHGV
jgi:hypothetical protein